MANETILLGSTEKALEIKQAILQLRQLQTQFAALALQLQKTIDPGLSGAAQYGPIIPRLNLQVIDSAGSQTASDANAQEAYQIIAGLAGALSAIDLGQANSRLL